MSSYVAPVRDMQFVIENLAGRADIEALPESEEFSADLVDAVLSEGARLAQEVLDPLNWSGDQQGASLGDDGVKPADGFGDAYRQFVEGGWNGLSSSTEFGGQGLPKLMASAISEIVQSANMSFSLCPMLTASAVEALEIHGSDEQKSQYLEKLISGEWTGTMNLTEPQAGSDLSAVAMKAVPEGDHYRLFGQKIYITWGDHDMTDNIIHMVLARTPDAPEGVKGISLFIVPKFLLADDGSPGERNDVYCVSLEHKLGIHASPTAVMAYGSDEGAIGYLVGEENKGLVYMFTMMNDARLAVGIQGMAIAERAYQRALAYAKDRVQGRPPGQKGGERVAILYHPDVRRMLMNMKSHTEAMRALCYVAAGALDVSRRHADEKVRASALARAELLIPVVKGWCTESGVEVTSLGVQVHGGMGFIEETGAAQHFRDARISTIYEGTTGIQSNDLVGRKLRMDKGAAMSELIDDMRATLGHLKSSENEDLQVIARHLSAAINTQKSATDYILAILDQDMASALGASVNYLMLTGYVTGGWQMARAALAAAERIAAGDASEFFVTKIKTARFYAEHLLPRAAALGMTIEAGTETLMALGEDQL
ncbi:MAG: acyl-CoA dehydrogenase [Gammaproteobacteria bacterium]|nr:acyl-CoA dehydrogenase [Gammaproteobacteria bacterium]